MKLLASPTCHSTVVVKGVPIFTHSSAQQMYLKIRHFSSLKMVNLIKNIASFLKRILKVKSFILIAVSPETKYEYLLPNPRSHIDNSSSVNH